MRADDPEVKAYADNLYEQLQGQGIEVIYDDRKVSAGFMFSDADLLGVPFRVVVSPRNMKNGIVEFSARDKSFCEDLPADTAAEVLVARVREALAQYQ